MNLSANTVFPVARDEQPPESMGNFSPSSSPPPLAPASKLQARRVAVKERGRILFVNLDEVVAVHAEGNYVSLRRNGGNHLLRESITKVAERLDAYGFIRIHRSVVVNTAFVEEIRPYSTGEYGLRVRGGKEYTVTRTYKKNLKSLAEFWIGAGVSFPE